MAETVLERIEQILHDVLPPLLARLEPVIGFTCEVWRKTLPDVYDEVYGEFGGEMDGELAKLGECKILLVPEGNRLDFMPVSDIEVGELEGAYAYTVACYEEDQPSIEIQVGDVLRLARDDNRDKRFKVVDRETIGLTTPIVYRLRLAAMPN